MQIARVLVALLSCIILAFTLSELYLTKIIVSYVAPPLAYSTPDSELVLTLILTVLLLPGYLLLLLLTNSASTCTVLTLSVIVFLRVLNSESVKYIISSLPLHRAILERVGTVLTLLKIYGALSWLQPAALICAIALHIYATYTDLAAARVESTASPVKQVLSETLRHSLNTALIILTLIVLITLALGYTQIVTT